MEFWHNYGFFLAKVVTVTAATLLILARAQQARQGDGGSDHTPLTLTPLNKRVAKLRSCMAKQVLSRKARRIRDKADKQRLKAIDKENRPKLFVLYFKGDIKASQVESLRHEISGILEVATPTDEVLLCIESPGGIVPNYGLAASQLARLRDQQIKLTVAIDRMAASGGYLMAAMANQIIAAPFAIVGSIGVVMQLPNFHKALKKHHIDFEQLTAGQYKRTLSMFGENTNEGRKKSQEDIEAMHLLFKQTIHHFRPNLDIKQVATGEIWMAAQALEKGLVDKLQTSDDYLRQACETHDAFLVKQPKKAKFSDKFSQAVRSVVDEIQAL